MTEPFITVTISDPVRQPASMPGGEFVTYKVNTSTNRPGFSYGQFSVLRRYSDFAWFHDQLCFAFPGVIMPPLPEKQAVGRFSTEFIESRRRGLEKFMARVLKHPTLLQSELLIKFLEADDVGLSAAKDKGKADKDKKNPSMMSWFETKVNTLTVQPANVEKTTSDLKMDEISDYIQKLENQMSSLSKHAGSLLKRNREVALAMREFGQAYTLLGQAEGEALGTSLIQCGTTSEELAVLNSDSVEAAIIQFDEPLQEYVRILASVRSATTRREAKKQAFLNAMIDLDAKVAAYNKALGVSGKEEVANQKQQQVEKAQSALDLAKEEYENTSRVVIEEFEVFKAQKAVELRDITLAFVTLQNDLNKKMEVAWLDLAQRLRNTEFPSVPAFSAAPSDSKYAASTPGFPQSHNSNPFAASNFREEEGEMIGV